MLPVYSCSGLAKQFDVQIWQARSHFHGLTVPFHPGQRFKHTVASSDVRQHCPPLKSLTHSWVLIRISGGSERSVKATTLISAPSQYFHVY